MPEETPRPYGTLLLFLFWALLLAAVFFWMLPGKPGVPPELQGVLRPAPQPLETFQLTDQYRQPFSLERLQGKWSLVFFGYTYCPDICPTTLSTLTGLVRRLKNDSQGKADVQVVFVSVDPERDTPELIEGYLEYFKEAFIGITGSPQDIESLARQFGAGYMKEPDTAAGQYLVSHTSSIFLVDPRGRLIAAFSPPHNAATIADQFRQIQALF
jgi:protein SCO1/2